MNILPNLPLLGQDQDIAFSIWVEGIASSSFAVTAFVVEEAIFGLTKTSVMLTSYDPDIDLDSLIDAKATLTIHHKYLPQLRHFSGIIAEAESGDEGHHRTSYRLTLLSSLYRLDNRSDCRIFQNQSVPEIVETLLKEHTIEDVEWNIGENHQQREYCVQYRETHLAFIERILAEEGIFYYYEHDKEGKEKLIISDLPYQLPTCSGGATLEYNALASGAVKGIYCSSLNRRRKLRATRFTQRDYTFKNPRAGLYQRQDAAQEKGEKQDYELYDYPGRYKQDAIGNTFTRTKLDAARVDAMIAHGIANVPYLVAGHGIKLTDHPSNALNINWRLLTIRHEGLQPQAWGEDAQGLNINRPKLSAPEIAGNRLTGVAYGTDRSHGTNLLDTMMLRGLDLSSLQADDSASDATLYACAFTAMDFKTPYRPPQSRKPLVDGPQMAHVVGPEGEEIYTDEHGRVKVHFPWDRHKETTAEDSSCWIRVASSWAGATWGAVSIPRIGHEVIVDFLEGDPDQPIVIGRTYHANNQNPYPLPDNKTKMVIRSDTHKQQGGAQQFNEISFEDEKGREEVFVHAQKDMNTYINNDKTEFVKGHSTVLNAGHEIRNYLSSSFSNVLGSVVYQVGPDFSDLSSFIAPALSWSAFKNIPMKSQIHQVMDSYSNSFRVTATGQVIMNGKSGVSLTSSSSFSINSTNDINIHTDGTHMSSSREDINLLSGQSINFIGKEKITIVCGKSKLILAADGAITLSGKSFNVQQTDAIDMKAKKISLN